MFITICILHQIMMYYWFSWMCTVIKWQRRRQVVFSSQCLLYVTGDTHMYVVLVSDYLCQGGALGYNLIQLRSRWNTKYIGKCEDHIEDEFKVPISPNLNLHQPTWPFQCFFQPSQIYASGHPVQEHISK